MAERASRFEKIIEAVSFLLSRSKTSLLSPMDHLSDTRGLRSTMSSDSDDKSNSIQPLLVKPKVAWKLLGCGNTRGYELLGSGELDSFLDGGSRKITMESIHRYIQRKLEEGSSLRPQ
jgi:hypothetical protein